MKYPSIIFKLLFFVLAILYVAVLTEFLSPESYNIKLNLNLDVLALTIAVIAYVVFFVRRSQ